MRKIRGIFLNGYPVWLHHLLTNYLFLHRFEGVNHVLTSSVDSDSAMSFPLCPIDTDGPHQIHNSFIIYCLQS